MKMKRFISALAALTMSVSCFAGLAITANAITLEENEAVDKVLLGTKEEDGTVTPENFDEATEITAGWSNSTGLSITNVTDITDIFGGLSLRMSGKAMRSNSKGGSFELDFDAPITTGKVVFGANFYVGTNAKRIQFIDKNDKVVAYFQFPDKNGSNAEATNQQYFYAGTDYADSYDAENSTYPVIATTFKGTGGGTRNREYDLSEVVIDLDAKTISYSGSVMDRRDGTNNWYDDTGLLKFTSIDGIKGVKLDHSSVGGNNYYAYLDNMKLYSIKSSDPTYGYTINYQLDGVTKVTESDEAKANAVITSKKVIEDESNNRYYQIANEAATLEVSSTEANNVLNVPVRNADIYSVGVVSSTGATIKDASNVVEGDPFAYTYHKYLTDSNNKVTAESDASTYWASTTPTKSGNISVDYNAYTGNPLYYADLGAGDASNSKLSNNDGNRRLGDGKKAITVMESGVYTVSYPTYKNGNSNGTVLVYRNNDETDVVVEEKTIDYTITNLASQSAEGVSLYKGDEIYVKNDGANAVVDYILLEKTADLETTVSEIAEVETPIALTSVTGKVGTEPTFETIEAFTTKYASTKQLKLVVTNPYDEPTYPVVTIAGTEYALTASDVTAVTENHVSTFYFEFAAESADKLKEFDTVTISYGADAKKVDKTYNFNPSTGD